jgi:hypothetical protein
VPPSLLGTGKSLTFLYSVVRASIVEHTGRAGVRTAAWFGFANLIELLILGELLSEQGAGWVACNGLVWLTWTSFSFSESFSLRRAGWAACNSIPFNASTSARSSLKKIIDEI